MDELQNYIDAVGEARNAFQRAVQAIPTIAQAERLLAAWCKLERRYDELGEYLRRKGENL